MSNIQVGHWYDTTKVIIGLLQAADLVSPVIASVSIQDGQPITLTGTFPGTGYRVFVRDTEVLVGSANSTTIVTAALDTRRLWLTQPENIYVLDEDGLQSNLLSAMILSATGEGAFKVTSQFLGDSSRRFWGKPDLSVNDEIRTRNFGGTAASVAQFHMSPNASFDVTNRADGTIAVSTFDYNIQDGDQLGDTWAPVTLNVQNGLFHPPSVEGLTLANAQAAAILAGMVSTVVNSVTSDTVLEGSVVTQFPKPDAFVLTGDTLELTLSLGKAKVAPPSLVGRTVDQATAALLAAGLVLGIVSKAIDGQNSGLVLNQSIAPSVPVALGTAVDIVISGGLIPEVEGEQYEQAVANLLAANLTVLPDPLTAYSPLPIGVVVLQSPAANTDASPGQLVTLTVSAGNAPQPPAELVRVRATREGYYGGYLRLKGDVFSISEPIEYSPYWMVFVDPIPADWMGLLREYNKLIDFDVLDRPIAAEKIPQPFRKLYE